MVFYSICLHYSKIFLFFQAFEKRKRIFKTNHAIDCKENERLYTKRLSDLYVVQAVGNEVDMVAHTFEVGHEVDEHRVVFGAALPS